MSWKEEIKKAMPKGEGGKHKRMGELFGGRGMRITWDAITGKEGIYKRLKSEEAKKLAMLLQEAKTAASELISKINDANTYYEENKDLLDSEYDENYPFPHDRKRSD